MKDYLNSQEKENMVRLTHYANDLKTTLEFNTLNKKEKADLKRAFTYTKKTIESVLERLNPSALKNYFRTATNSRTYLHSYADVQINLKKKSADSNACYEENKEYYNLIALIFDYNCKNCNRNGPECEIYKEFEKQSIVEFDGTDKCTNCKYSWSNTNGRD